MSGTDPARSAAPITLVVLLYVHAGREAEYERFETEASRIMGRHGGRIVRRIKLAGARGAAAPAEGAAPANLSRQPDEVHIVEFADGESLSRYRADPEIRALADLRAAAIRDTIVWEGGDAASFGGG
jgi:uncharacterized protein (DUF1330 family)